MPGKDNKKPNNELDENNLIINDVDDDLDNETVIDDDGAYFDTGANIDEIDNTKVSNDDIKIDNKKELEKDIKIDDKSKDNINIDTNADAKKAENNKALNDSAISLNKVVNGAIKIDKEIDFRNNLNEKLHKAVPVSVNKTVLDSTFQKHYKEVLKSTLKTLAKERTQEKSTLSISEVTREVDKFMQEEYKSCIEGTALEGTKYPVNGGIPVVDIRGIQMDAYLSLPEKMQTSKERNEIEKEFLKNTVGLRESVNYSFQNGIREINRAEGLELDQNAVENELRNCWKNCNAKENSEKQTMFKKELREFAERYFQKVVDKTDFNTDLRKQLEDFDNFYSAVEDLCKSNGWMDPHESHQLYGGLNPNKIKEIQMGKVDHFPKDSDEWAKQTLNSTLSNPNLSRGEKRAFLNDLADTIAHNVPFNNGGEPSKDIYDAVAIIRTIEANRHDRKSDWGMGGLTQDRAIRNIIVGLENKGYSTEMLSHLKGGSANMTRNVYESGKLGKVDEVNNLYIENERIFNDDFSIDTDDFYDREPLEVNEADNLWEIINPKEVTPFLQPERYNQVVEKAFDFTLDDNNNNAITNQM